MAERIDTTEMWELLQADTENAEATPEVGSKITTSRIRTAVGVFQPRKLSGQINASEEHIKVLMRVIHSGRELDPVLIWWSGRHWYVIDGHHRLLAYRRSRKDTIPVKVAFGSLQEMVAKAASLNSKDQLTMTTQDKSNMAWRLVTLTSNSKRDIARACGVSEATVANMRRALRKLEARSIKDALPNFEWWQIRMLLDGDDGPSETPDEKFERDVKHLTKRLRKYFSGGLSKAPLVFAAAIARYDQELPRMIFLSDPWYELFKSLKSGDGEAQDDFEKYMKEIQDEYEDDDYF